MNANVVNYVQILRQKYQLLLPVNCTYGAVNISANFNNLAIDRRLGTDTLQVPLLNVRPTSARAAAN